MQSKRNSIELSIKDKNYNPGQNTTFETKTIRYSDLENTFKTHNFSVIKWRNNYRSSDNFISASGFIVDIDDGLTMTDAEATLNKHNLNYALITSKSHTDQAHRFHILLPFERLVFTEENYRAVAEQIKKDLFPSLDTNTMDLARYIFGSKANAMFSSNFSLTPALS